MGKRHSVSLTLLFIIFSCRNVHALTVGSDSLVSRSNFVTFPQAEVNTIEGFVLMDQGFGLQNSGTALVYNGAFPVVQNMFLNGGTLTLSRDLTIETMTTFTSLGSIVGNAYALNLPSALQSIGYYNDVPGSFGTIIISLNSHTWLDAALTFSGVSELNGNNNKITFSPNGAIMVAPNSTLTIKNITLDQLANSNLACADNTAHIILQDVECVIDTLYTFSMGACTYRDEISFSGTGTFVYESSLTSTICRNTTLHVTNQLTFNIGASLVSGAQPFYFTDGTSSILFDDCYFYVRYPGVSILSGSLLLDRNVTIDMGSTSSQNGMILGDGMNLQNDATIYYAPAAITTFNSGCLVYNNVSPNQFISTSNSSEIIRNVGANTYVATNWNISNITSKVQNYSVSPIQFAPSVTLSFNNVDIIYPDSFFNLNGSINGATTFDLNGNESLSLTKGSFLAAILAIGVQNSIVGNGKVDGPIFLAGPTAQLTWDVVGVAQSNLTLYGGTLTLNKDLDLGSQIVINGPGTVFTNNNSINVDLQNVTPWTTPLTIYGTNGGITLNSNMVLSNVWTCTGTVVIDGQGNDLTLGTNGGIVVASGSTLTLQNIILKNATGTKVSCVDDTGIITLQNVEWTLDGIYTFSYGAFNYVDEVTYSGTGTFVYDSDQTSTIASNSQLQIINGATFTLGRSIGSGNEPYYFTDATSQLVLDNCYFLILSHPQGVIDCDLRVIGMRKEYRAFADREVGRGLRAVLTRPRVRVPNSIL